jgi:hypothetical protein
MSTPSDTINALKHMADDHGCCKPACEDAVDCINQLRAELAEALKDKARLDWLDVAGRGYVRGTDYNLWSIEGDEDDSQCIRQAIDAAMKEQKA